MFTTLLIFAAMLFVLYGLIASTERIMTQRNEYVVIDERMTDHRSRL